MICLTRQMGDAALEAAARETYEQRRAEERRPAAVRKIFPAGIG
jgi:hypothetical protein